MLVLWTGLIILFCYCSISKDVSAVEEQESGPAEELGYNDSFAHLYPDWDHLRFYQNLRTPQYEELLFIVYHHHNHTENLTLNFSYSLPDNISSFKDYIEITLEPGEFKRNYETYINYGIEYPYLTYTGGEISGEIELVIEPVNWTGPELEHFPYRRIINYTVFDTEPNVTVTIPNDLTNFILIKEDFTNEHTKYANKLDWRYYGNILVENPSSHQIRINFNEYNDRPIDAYIDDYPNVVEPGTSKNFTIRVQVPEDQPVGKYEISISWEMMIDKGLWNGSIGFGSVGYHNFSLTMPYYTKLEKKKENLDWSGDPAGSWTDSIARQVGSYERFHTFDLYSNSPVNLTIELLNTDSTFLRGVNFEVYVEGDDDAILFFARDEVPFYPGTYSFLAHNGYKYTLELQIHDDRWFRIGPDFIEILVFSEEDPSTRILIKSYFINDLRPVFCSTLFFILLFLTFVPVTLSYFYNRKKRMRKEFIEERTKRTN